MREFINIQYANPRGNKTIGKAYNIIINFFYKIKNP